VTCKAKKATQVSTPASPVPPPAVVHTPFEIVADTIPITTMEALIKRANAVCKVLRRAKTPSPLKPHNPVDFPNSNLDFACSFSCSLNNPDLTKA
jgi:hypothetical protein